MIKIEYIFASLLGVVLCIIYIVRVPSRKFENFAFLLLTSAGIIGGLQIAWISLFDKRLNKIQSDARFLIFAGAVCLGVVSVNVALKILETNFYIF